MIWFAIAVLGLAISGLVTFVVMPLYWLSAAEQRLNGGPAHE